MAENGNIAVPVLETIMANCEHTREVLAEIVGSDKSEIAFIRSIAEGMNMIAHSFSWEPWDEVIITDQENPAGILPWMNLVKLKGIKLKKLNLANDKDIILSRLEELITPKTRMVSISHVTHVCGLCLPAKEICNLAHQNDILVMLDGAQAVGQLPVDLKDLDCDFYLFSGHKWLLGPVGTCGLYINKKHFDYLNPPFLGEGSQKYFDFGTDSVTLRGNARRYEFGGRHWPLYQALGKAAEFTANVGVEEIEKRARKLSVVLRDLISGLPRVQILSPEAPDLSTGIFTFSVRDLDAVKLVDRLWKEKRILIQWRRLNLLNDSKGIRVSLAWFITEEELEKLAYHLKTILNE